MKRSQLKEALKHYEEQKGLSRRFFKTEPHVSKLNKFLSKIKNEDLSSDELFNLVVILKGKSGTNQSASTEVFKKILDTLASYNSFGNLNLNGWLTKEYVLLLIENKERINPDILVHFIILTKRRGLDPIPLINLIGIENLEWLMQKTNDPDRKELRDEEQIPPEKILNYYVMNALWEQQKNDFVFLLNFLKETHVLTLDSLESTKKLVARFNSMHYQLAITLFSELDSEKLLTEHTLQELAKHAPHFDQIAKACTLFHHRGLLTQVHWNEVLNHPEQATTYAHNQGCNEELWKIPRT